MIGDQRHKKDETGDQEQQACDKTDLVASPK